MRFTSRFLPPFAAVFVVSVVGLAAASLGACSVGTSNVQGLIGDEAGTTASPDGGTGGSAGSSGSTGSSGTVGEPVCKPDPTCDRQLCECDDGKYMATDGVCADDGTCDNFKRCTAACGAAKFSGSTFVEKACSDEGEKCLAFQPTVSCQCNQGFELKTYPRCTKGYCSSAAMNACPASCASQGGWTCKSASDCTPVVCGCKDGQFPVTGGPCQGTSCAPTSAVCPAACTAHGGWAGSGGVTPDAGPPGPKQPGDACVAGSECTPFDCTCNNGTKFNQLKSCQNMKCATKAQACGNGCLGSGGWNGL